MGGSHPPGCGHEESRGILQLQGGAALLRSKGSQQHARLHQVGQGSPQHVAVKTSGDHVRVRWGALGTEALLLRGPHRVSLAHTLILSLSSGAAAQRPPGHAHFGLLTGSSIVSPLLIEITE